MTAIETLERRAGANWASIRAARAKTEEIVAQLGEALAGIHDANCSIVVTGSLGRSEATSGSDADWVLLVDGPADPQHALLVRDIDAKVRAVVPKEVGRTGTFGDLVASHELVHYIAGTRDSNENLTRRILLLLESRALTNAPVRERIIRNILARYVFYDRAIRRLPVPLFLYNDIVRYWRTIASDYASKMWERSREGWGIRNIKLRFSRKLLYLGGLLTALSGELFATDELNRTKSDEEYLHGLAELIRKQTDEAPLELVARVALECEDDSVATDIFGSYDRFLEVLSDPVGRKHLDEVKFDDALVDPTYGSLREASHPFRRGVERLCFDAHPTLPKLFRNYGVF
ncbi:MAG TPA: DUF294 nucleotidyltransferase-like domain-containing protein [Thermoanaerobaculia bacterium]